jgi:glycosyltransferase involved in cell wall biosynthesis
MNPGHVRRIRAWLSGRGLESQVRLLGVVDGPNLADLYATSQVFAMPFAHEGFGIAALEAMAFGLPVIGSTAGGVPEFVRNGTNGFLIAAGDHAAVCRHLAGFYHDRNRLVAMGGEAFRTFSAHPTWDQSMQSGCAFLEKVANAA